MYGENKNGVGKPPLIDRQRKAVITSSFAEAVRDGNCYSGANQAGVIFTIELATTYTGLCLKNPLLSGKILRILAAGYSEIKVPANEITDYWLATGFHASTEPTVGSALTARNLRAGGSAGVGVVLDGSELPVAPKYVFPIMTGKTTNVLSVAAAPGLVRIDGLVALPPGGFAIIACFTIGVAGGGKGAILWQEIDI